MDSEELFCDSVTMKNITVSVDDETYHRSRMKAAELDTSVSALVRAFLVSLVQEDSREDAFDQLKRLQDETLRSIHARVGGFRSIDNVDRDALHGRDAVR